MSRKNIFDLIAKEAKTIFSRNTKDKVYSSNSIYPTEEEANKAYEKAVEKLFAVDAWSNLPGVSSQFELYNPNGERKKDQLPKEGDFLKIILPGPLPENWVVITEIGNEKNEAYIIVSPSYDPLTKNKDKIEHFFINEATSKFLVEKKGNTLYAYEIGRNEGINNKEDAGNREILNTLISEGGWAGFQKLQWQKLTDFLTHKIKLDETKN